MHSLFFSVANRLNNSFPSPTTPQQRQPPYRLMDESERVVELKKAYAEMIVNVAREAAVRVADSERRASRFRRDLSCAREEAVRMLVRFKRLLDARTLEAETTTAKKEEQIAVLEAQLEEAESKILDLRMELENVRDELEIKKTKNNASHSEENKSSSNCDLPQNHFDPFEPIVPYCSDSDLENAANLDTKEGLVTGVATVQRSCNGTKPVGQLADPGLEVSDGQKTDFSTMIMGSTEPELYRNGCTQRVRAFEGHLLQGTLGCKLDCGTHDKGENKVQSLSQSKNLEIEKMLPLPELEKPTASRKMRRKTTPSKKSKSTPIPVYAKQWRRQHVVSSLPSGKSCSPNDYSEFDKDFSTNQIKNANNVDVRDSTLNLQKRLQSGDDYTIEGKAVKRKGRRKARGRKNLTNTFQFLSKQPNITESARLRHCQGKSVETNTTSKELDDGEGIIKEEKSEGLGGSGLVVKKRDLVDDYSLSVKCEHDTAANNMLVPYEESEREPNCVNSDVDVGRNVHEDERSVQSDGTGLVKYTFQRKQKRAPSSNVDKNEAALGSTVRKRAGDTLKTRPESRGCKAMDGASRDSRRLAQVARQLIALSGRRW